MGGSGGNSQGTFPRHRPTSPEDGRCVPSAPSKQRLPEQNVPNHVSEYIGRRRGPFGGGDRCSPACLNPLGTLTKKSVMMDRSLTIIDHRVPPWIRRPREPWGRLPRGPRSDFPSKNQSAPILTKLAGHVGRGVGRCAAKTAGGCLPPPPSTAARSKCAKSRQLPPGTDTPGVATGTLGWMWTKLAGDLPHTQAHLP